MENNFNRMGRTITSIVVISLFALLPIVTGSGTIAPLWAGGEKICAYDGFAEIDASKNHFIVVGDTQKTGLWEFWRERNDRERRIIVNEMERRGPAFVLHLGDLTTRGGSRKQWQEFDELHTAFGERAMPYFPVLGNHEFYGNRGKALGYYFTRFPHLEHRGWYSFTWKKVGLIMFDSKFSTLSLEEIREQAQWCLGELGKFEKDEKVDFVIVCCHEPPFTNSRVVSPNEKVKILFADPFVQFEKTSLFFSGHSHSYERFQSGNKLFVVSGGGGGPRHKVHVDPKKQRREDLFLGPELRFFHICELQVGEEGLAYSVLRLGDDRDFSVVDRLMLGKSRGRTGENENPMRPVSTGTIGRETKDHHQQ